MSRFDSSLGELSSAGGLNFGFGAFDDTRLAKSNLHIDAISSI
jgi:hypothetical protein